MNVFCYPMGGKQKSLDICQAFSSGCNGAVAHKWRPGDAFFYGISDSNQEAWENALLNQHSHDFYYCDNAYFDKARGTHFRITRNRLQHDGVSSESNGKRLAALGIQIKPWRTTGKHIVICPQSDDFMRRIVGYNGDWLADTQQTLALTTDRPLKIRHWNRDKMAAAATLHDDLRDAWALVTWSSAAAIEAVLAGIPVSVSGQSAAAPFTVKLDQLEQNTLPQLQQDRSSWAATLADNQWTINEIKTGTAWAQLKRQMF
jgi:hypothetical protein